MNNERLNAFLVDDVTALVDFINANNDIQAIATPDCQFENLGEFASYWSNHIGRLSE